jgi:hypothetical protein
MRREHHRQGMVRTTPAILFLVLPSSLLVASLAIILSSLEMSSLWLGIAHESAGRSLPGIILYPGHALRELPHVGLFALCWVGAQHPELTLKQGIRRLSLVLGTVAACGLIFFAWASLESSISLAWLDLFQHRAAPDLEGFGVHFRYHFWSDLVRP